MKNAIMVLLSGFVLLFSGCVTGGGQGTSAKVDEENIFHLNFPDMEIRVAKDIKYINVDEDKYEEKPNNIDGIIDKISVTSRRYAFLNPYDAELECIKLVYIQTDDVGIYSYCTPANFEKFPGIINHGSTQIEGAYYQFGIALNNFPMASIKNDLLSEANLKLGHSGPIKMITKIYYRTIGSDSSRSLMISYSESIPKSLEWHTSSILTDEHKAFLEAFQKRCDQNMIILE